jgi:phenylalanine ammonia-lyase
MTTPLTTPGEARASGTALIVRGDGLSIADIARVAEGGRVVVADDEPTRRRLRQSYDFVERAVEGGTPIYGVTTLVGGMANQSIGRDTAVHLQNNLVWALAAGSGGRLAREDVRAAMLLRMNTLVRGISGIRVEVLQRFQTFLNAGVTPHVPECGSIGASGDLVPLA